MKLSEMQAALLALVSAAMPADIPVVRFQPETAKARENALLTHGAAVLVSEIVNIESAVPQPGGKTLFEASFFVAAEKSVVFEGAQTNLSALEIAELVYAAVHGKPVETGRLPFLLSDPYMDTQGVANGVDRVLLFFTKKTVQ